jgi:predicted transcriptional regulator
MFEREYLADGKLKVRDLMIKEVISIDLEASVREAANLMAHNEIGSLVVT